MNKTLFARSAIALAVLYELLLVLLILIRPDLPVYSTTISEWAIGKFGWLMQTAFFASALSYLFLALALKDEFIGLGGKGGWILLLVCFCGTLGVGAFVTNPYPPDMTITTTLIHTICGTSAMILLPLAAALVGFNLSTQPEWSRYQRSVRSISLLPLLAFLGFVIHLNLYVIPLGKNGVGPNVPIGYPPRILFFCYHTWLVILASLFLNVKHSKQLSL